jgi:hypothetical protein
VNHGIDAKRLQRRHCGPRAVAVGRLAGRVAGGLQHPRRKIREPLCALLDDHRHERIERQPIPTDAAKEMHPPTDRKLPIDDRRSQRAEVPGLIQRQTRIELHRLLTLSRDVLQLVEVRPVDRIARDHQPALTENQPTVLE